MRQILVDHADLYEALGRDAEASRFRALAGGEETRDAAAERTRRPGG